MPVSEPQPIWCEKCEEKMDVLGESYTGEISRPQFPGAPPEVSVNKKSWFIIHKCKKCKAYKDIPLGA